MSEAYNHWLSFLTDIESYAKLVGTDLNGVKLWINVFWQEDGQITNVVYHPKPNSKNISTEELSSFFQSFIEEYEAELANEHKYSHYGSATFPVFPQRVSK